MTLEEIKKLLENKLNRIENCETQFHIGQKQQIADVLLMLSKLHQPAVIKSVCDVCNGDGIDDSSFYNLPCGRCKGTGKQTIL